MKRYSYFFLLLLGPVAFAQTPVNVDKEFDFAANQYELMLKSHPDTTKFPQSTKPTAPRRPKIGLVV